LLYCPYCMKNYPERELRWRCECGGYLIYKPDRIGFPDEGELVYRQPDIWRYREALPIDEGSVPVSMGEGMTALVPVPWDGRKVFFKLDYLCPTGSYKDRGISYLVSKLKELGVGSLIEDSSGNAGAAMAAYCARASIDCEIFVPSYTSGGKCVQIEMYGAKLRKIPGTREDTTRAAELASEKTYYASHNWSPYFVHGIKTLAFEIWEQLGGKAPDNIILPLGQGSLIMGAKLGFQELLDAGKIECLPRIYAVQSANCDPLAKAFKRKSDQPVRITKKETIAEGISSSEPVKGDMVLSDVRNSDGYILEVGEESIWSSFIKMCSLGFYVEPTSAVVGPALDELFDNGSISEGETTVALLTGSGLKATDKILHYKEAFASS